MTEKKPTQAQQVAALQEQLKVAYHRLSILERKSRGITRANAETARLTREMELVQLQIRELKAELSNLSTPLWVWLLATAAGVVAGFWWHATDFIHTGKVGELVVQFTYEFAESPLGAIMAGAAAFAIVFGLAEALRPKGGRA